MPGVGRIASVSAWSLAGTLGLSLLACHKPPAPSADGPDIQTVWSASGTTTQHDLAAGGGNFYWMDPSVQPNVLYVRRPDAPPSPLWKVDGPGTYRRLAASERGAMVTRWVPSAGGASTVRIELVPADGSPPALFAQTGNDAPLAFTGERVVFADLDRVLIAAPGAPAELVATTETPAVALAAHGTRVAWIERGKGDGTALLRTLPSPGGPPVTLATGLESGRLPPMLAADDARVYFPAAPARSRQAAPDASPAQGMAGYAEIRAATVADGHVETVLTSDWPITWWTVFGGRVYAWEVDPASESRGRLASKAIVAAGPVLLEKTAGLQTGGQPPFVIDETWITWTNLFGLHRTRRGRPG